MSNTKGLRAFHNARLKRQQRKAYDLVEARNRAILLHRAGRIADAQAVCREILERAPRHFDALHLLGVTEYQSGRHDEADRLLEQALLVEPRSPAACSNHGIVLHELKRYDAALARYDRAIALKPDYAEAYSNRAMTLTELERFAEAVASCDEAIALKPDYPEAHSNRGNALCQLRRFDEAVASCDRAIALRPGYADAMSNRGNVLTELGRFDEALASYDQALALKPSLAAAWVGRGNVFLNLNRYGEAFAAFQQALAIKPDQLKALAQLAHYYERHGRMAEAIGCYDRVLAVKPDFPEVISNKIFALDLLPQMGFGEHQEARKEWWRKVGAKIAAQSLPRHVNDRDPARRLLLGYVSADFRRHSAATTFSPVLANHDKERFEVICYSCSTIRDDITQDFERVADRFIDTSQLSDEDLTARVRGDKVDILIDLSGHSGGNRLGVFARKPAPVQVTAWGHGTGTGLPTIDYLFSDSVTIPEAKRWLYAEKIYDLPCVIMSALPAIDLPRGEPPVLTNGHVTFGVFNRITKISDDALAVWARVLRGMPDAKLLMKDGAYDEPPLRDLMRQRFAAHGIAGERIDFLGASPREQHLAAFGKTDIALDPFPQNGGVSTWEALHMGVPAVAKLGHSAPSRLSGAILTSIGMGDWVAHSADDYVALAVNFAGMPDVLTKLRRELPATIAAAPSGNGTLYTRAVERGYRTMWENYCREQI
ncbi:MAG TPA: tetratricopeptide repeat protein [Xanthobacteraceae bacterium]|jgi:predicted O-linked N-acetylglucosamine transferase (SPINDLY family)|nr:tetratricopeptide repeat protein [Xanthobacteraceae bacterium]